MRVLVVAPEQANINSIPEVRRIQSLHHTSTLNGTVTAEDIYTTCQQTAFDVLHFATNGGPEGVVLSGGMLFPAEDIAQVARLKESRGVFFNACHTSKLASYCVRHGVRWAISSETLQDGGAWKPAAAFYSHLRNGHSHDFVGAYLLGDSGDGDFALHIDPVYVQELQRMVMASSAATIPHAMMTISRNEAMIWATLLALGSAGLWAVLTILTGRFQGF